VPRDNQQTKIDKSYNSKNFFTENFDDQAMEDAINKIKSNPNFDKSNSSPDNGKNPPLVQDPGSPNVVLNQDELSISFEENNWKIKVPTKPNNSNHILVNDDGDTDLRYNNNEMHEESSNSDFIDHSKSTDSKKDGFTRIKTKFDKFEKKDQSHLVDTTQEESCDQKQDNQEEKIDTSKHLNSSEDIDQLDLTDNIHPISKIDIERIGSPNKPQQVRESKRCQSEMQDDRNKLDDDEDDAIITGSQTIGSKKSKKNYLSLHDYVSESKTVEDDDLGQITQSILKDLMKEMDKELFPQRPLFFLTADLSTINLEQATTLLHDLTPEKERIIVEKIIEKQAEDKRRKRSNKAGTDNSKLVLYEKKGIRTDLVAVESYVEALHKHVDKNKRKAFMKELFSSVKHDPFEMLNQLQNSDIGSYEHFQVDMGKLAVLSLNTYLEMEKYWKSKQKEEDDKPKEDQVDLTSSKNSKSSKKRSKRRRIDFDETGLTKEQIQEKKKVFSECEHIHNKALFDCVNEALVQFRPYTKDGEPAPWSNKKRTLKQGPKQPKYNIKKIFEKARNDMFRW
jgi:hypothetical protein